jgi:ADP-L-glycero-D-manno-heptose 6-epimerase
LIVVTGGAGFIGSHLVQALNERGRSDILVVDELENGHKLLNLVGLDVADVIDRERFMATLASGDDAFAAPIEAILHQGACSDTTAWDGRHVLARNYDDPKLLVRYCSEREIPFIYASSASVYGSRRSFREQPADERPRNLYAFSKLLFDQWVRRALPALRCPVVGLRYFNVYGPRESHKGPQASVAYQHFRQLHERGRVELFAGSGGYADGEQQRDFVWVGDCARVNLWFLENRGPSGIYNVGTGKARTFNDLARCVVDHFGHGEIRYVPFPASLAGHYQSYTCADLGALRKAGYGERFLSIEEGVPRYMEWLEQSLGTDDDSAP